MFIVLVFGGFLILFYVSVVFNIELIELDNSGMDKVDLLVFELGLQVVGIYYVDIIVDDVFLEMGDIQFIVSKVDNGDVLLQFCLSFV